MNVRIDTVQGVMERRAVFLADFVRRFGLDADPEEADRQHVAICGRMSRGSPYQTRRYRANGKRP